MKKQLILLMISNFFLQTSLAQKTDKTAIELLQTSASKLNNLNSISYLYTREINNYQDNYFDKTSDSCYLDFGQSNEENPLIFQFKGKEMIQIYNGSEYFVLDKKDKTIEVTNKPSLKTFSSLSCFYNSLPTLRKMMNTLAKDDSVEKTIRDTLVTGKPYKVINLILHNKTLDFSNGYKPFTIPLIINYKLLIDPENYLPYQIIETNNIDKDLYNTRTTFLNLKINPVRPDSLSWFYSSYRQTYKFAEKKEQIHLLKSGRKISEWVLPVLTPGGNKMIQRTDFKGKITVIYFWMKNCGYCMQSFPKLRVLQQKYQAADFQLLAINSYDKKEDVIFFYQREKPGYLMLYNGQVLAEKSGVSSYPATIIIDKNGSVLYSSNGFNLNAVKQQLKKALSKK